MTEGERVEIAHHLGLKLLAFGRTGTDWGRLPGPSCRFDA
jgi:hypothetical protein